MEKFAKILESQVRIQYHDCDPFNHLNNSRYIDYIMGARTEQLLAEYGFNASELAISHESGWVAAHTQISYFLPASWMELVTIESRLLHFSEHSVLVEGCMWDAQKTRLKAVLWAKLVHFNVKAQSSTKHIPEHIALFNQIVYPHEGITTFEERLAGLKNKTR
jgi:acyl-CoA thioester hydrolase